MATDCLVTSDPINSVREQSLPRRLPQRLIRSLAKSSPGPRPILFGPLIAPAAPNSSHRMTPCEQRAYPGACTESEPTFHPECSPADACGRQNSNLPREQDALLSAQYQAGERF